VFRWSNWACALLFVVGCQNDGGDAGAGTGTGDDGQDDADDGGTDGSGTDDADGTDTDDDGAGIPPISVPFPLAARLTHTQYRYSVQDVLDVELTADELDALPRDIPTGRDYSTTVITQAFSSQYVLAYAEVARSVTERLDPTDLVMAFGGCDAPSPACRPAFVQSLGRRLYRRPLTPEESERYIDLAEAIASQPEATESDAVRGVAQALLQAPQFLYRMEHETDGVPGEIRQVDGYELASRWSYFLWQSAPDETLLTFAAAMGEDGVFDPDAAQAEVQRMIADEKFARARDLFWGDYTTAARSAFGTDDPALAEELRTSVLATVEHLSADEPQPLSALFVGEQMMMTPAVAELAGVAVKGPGLQSYDVADMEQRLGVVTHPAFLAAVGTTSFVGRGLFLSERLLCQTVAEPPPDVEEEIEQTAEATEHMTPREASEFRFGLEPVCLGCHTQFEPIAYGFEQYDMIGRYATSDEQGRALYSDGLLPAFGDRPEIEFDDAPQLLTELAELDTTYTCLVHNMTKFGTGQPVQGTGDFIPAAAAAFTDGGLTFDALVAAVASSEQRALARVTDP